MMATKYLKPSINSFFILENSGNFSESSKGDNTYSTLIHEEGCSEAEFETTTGEALTG
jgi:hypothetical protein